MMVPSLLMAPVEFLTISWAPGSMVSVMPSGMFRTPSMMIWVPETRMTSLVAFRIWFLV